MPPPEDPVELLCVIEHREPSALDDTPGREKLQNNCVIHLRAHIKNSEPAGYGCVKIRALKTMPVMLALSWSEAVEGQMGIWAKEDLGANSFFGPYEGKKPPYSTKTRKCSCREDPPPVRPARRPFLAEIQLDAVRSRRPERFRSQPQAADSPGTDFLRSHATH
ncbi:hypothetical protein C7M84_024056 [Penaeus vannamei]|uniref:Uncharacterized protein n=1 Tax=Penaeus vannamei TaxID=6689 RepID=A0A423U235_PENVA|nr:hypothetical protein C7M84_024056 [Penaeus vannamei]